MSTRKPKKKARHRCRQQPDTSRRHSPQHPHAAALLALEGLFTRYAARDVYAALFASDLWPANIKARARHILAFATFIAVAPERFSDDRHIHTHAELTLFLAELYGLLPDLPLLEDFTPEADWGEIRTVAQGRPLKVFFGGTLERVTDFIDAFRMTQAPLGAEVHDLDHALLHQDALLSLIENPRLSPGIDHQDETLHAPSEHFWRQCLAALPALAQLAIAFPLRPELIAHLGQPVSRGAGQTFGGALAAGDALPYALIQIDGELLPLSPREAIGAVMHDGGRKASIHPRRLERRVSTALATFIQKRLRHTARGPYVLGFGDRNGPFLEVATTFHVNDELWVVTVIAPDQAPAIDKIERALTALLERQHALIAMALPSRELMVLGDATQRAIKPRLLVVIAEASTDMKILTLPPSTAHTLFLPDFISIVQAATDIDELAAYFDFVDRHEKMLFAPLIGPVGLFAAFRQFHGVLVDGATTPHMIMMDPHWGSRWRFNEQKAFWRAAPARFPDDEPTSWSIEHSSGLLSPLRTLKARSAYVLDWMAELPEASVHATLDAEAQELTPDDGRVLELFIHLLADSVIQRHELLPPGLLRRRVVTHCLANEASLPSQVEGEHAPSTMPLLSAWEILKTPPTPSH